MNECNDIILRKKPQPAEEAKQAEDGQPPEEGKQAEDGPPTEEG